MESFGVAFIRKDEPCCLDFLLGNAIARQHALMQHTTQTLHLRIR